MSLNHQDQVNLLQDILNNHLEDCCGAVSEYEQVERLIQSLLANQSVPQEMEPLLHDIYSYSQTGKNSSDLDQHINAHQDQLSQWVHVINTLS
ncbi:putative Zn-dependent peptidase [Lederbergia galactosidilyticus]|uniref:YtzH-like family protein n=1 Tax=Lederbergia galactosidilytica TaxID=217031 RepID=UPI001AE59537|nr:YtzH-like family protein [Lederbergia galactosidilytica]MBP1915290.1 putative Zn-dependent peptidase [Lederbergia galactosidilytica]